VGDERPLAQRPQWTVVTIDGSYGEGGGQILRTSASLAAITGQPVRIENVRAGRASPGLKAQHLTAIQAAMRVCNGSLEGARVGSTDVVLTPGSPVQAGRYEFDIGTAGSTALVLQTLLLPLLRTEEPSHVSLVGGTHNLNAPSSDYLRHTFLRGAALQDVEIAVERVGFFPRGGGRMTVDLRPDRLGPIDRAERGARTLLTAIVSVSDILPPHIVERAHSEIRRRAQASGWVLEPVFVTSPTFSPGMAVHLDAAYENGAGGFTALGRKGLPTERVVEEAWTAMEAFDGSGATVDEHLADQLVLPALFADGASEYRTSRVTEHLRTMAWLVPQFGVGRIAIDEAKDRVRVYPA